MKRLLLFPIFLLIAIIGASAQDVIVKKDGGTIVAKVEKISSSEVIYKKFSNLDGPSYTISVSELKTINYENGESDQFENISEEGNVNGESPTAGFITQETASSYSNDEYLRNLYYQRNVTNKNKPYDLKISNNYKIIGLTVGPVLCVAGGIAMALGCIPWNWMGDHPALAFGIGAPVFALGATTMIYCLVKSNQYKRLAQYQMLSFSPIYSHEFVFKNGSNLNIGIDAININGCTRNCGLGLSYTF